MKSYKDEAKAHLTNELLPFWLNRCKDEINGGFITHFDANGSGKCAKFARHSVDFTIESSVRQ